jgi:NADH:ubiquinone oxidoreductase subunit E
MMPVSVVSMADVGFLGSEGQLGPIDANLTGLVDDWVASRPGGQERLIPLLHRVQHELGYLPPAAQMLVADRLQLSPVQVAGVVSFYHFFTTVPRGRYQLKVCMGTACFVRGGNLLISAIQDTLGIGLGEVTEDRVFSFEQVRCIGACGLAPAMMVNDDVYGHLDATGVRKLVRKLRSRAKKEEAANG